MKNIIIFLTFLLTMGVVSGQESSKGALLSIEAPSYDFGEIARADGDVAHRFTYINDGDLPLVLTRIVSSCSCMKIKYDRKPVMPGQGGEIKIIYLTRKGDIGAFNKVVHIFSNSKDGKNIVTVRGIIVQE